MNLKHLALPILLLPIMACSGSTTESKIQQEVYLWPDSLQSEETGSRILPSQGDNISRITDVKIPSMDVFPVNSDGPTPAVLIFPGGGYRILSYDLEGTEVAEWLNDIGITAFVVKYTVPNDRESAFHDGKRAIKIVRENAHKWNIDSSKIGVLGFSAGGHLAVRLSTDFKSSAYQRVDNTDELSSRPDFSIYVYPAYLNKDGSNQLAPEIKLSKDIPPAFIVQTKDDTNYIDGTMIFSESLDSIGIEHQFHLIEKGGHGYGLRADKSLMISTWPELAEEWFHKQNILN